jgi:tetratricopeptide (TPR) repeat protein
MFRFVIATVTITALAAALYWSARLAAADYHAGQGALDRAVAADPFNARYRLGRAGEHPGELPAAARLNPYSARARIEMGLRAEAAGDLAQAERLFLDAAGLDAAWLPRWTLANYYFRRGDKERFWKWAAEAGRMAHGDVRALYELCWMVEPDPRKILAAVVPRRAEPTAWFYHFLLARRELDAAAETLDHLMGYGRPQDRPEAAAFCDIALDTGRQDLAIAAWTAAIRRGILRYAAPAPVTNGDFAVAPLGRGFDWRLPAVEGVMAERPRGGGLRLTLDRSRPERCDLLWQYLPVSAGAAYRVEYRHDGDIPAWGGGLRWVLRAGGVVIARSEPFAAGRDGRGSFSFRASEAGPVRLALVYEREPGRSVWEGAVRLLEVSATAER